MTYIAKERRAIAKRAMETLGVRFRLHGRSMKTGLDCVGLVTHAIAPHIKGMMIPRHYNLRYDDVDIPLSFFSGSNFNQINFKSPYQCGDIILVAPASNQLHFLIMSDDAFVHAHCGLRRIVMTNLPILSPVKAVWRYKGN